MLSLTCKANGIYLMRERGGGGSGSQEEIDYVSIDEMRKYVSLALHGREDEVFMLDYIFICFLLGNDFLPHPLMLSIKHSGIDILCNAYKSVYEERGGADTCIVEKKKTGGDGDGDGKAVYAINYDFLKDMLRHLMMVENDSITEIMKDYDQMNFINKRFMDPVDKYAYDVDFTPLREKSANRKIISQYHPKNPMWRNAYYYHLFGINPHTDLQGINDTCKNFLDGLEWNVNYYFNGVFSHNWFYKYPHAPTIKDLYHMVVNMTGDTRGCEKKCEEELVIKPWEQLLIVLPYHSKYLVPEKYRKYITDARLGCSHMYPTEFYIHTHLKRQLWECIPILPVIDIHRFLRMVRSGA
jgi:5'-3' exonuclease